MRETGIIDATHYPAWDRYVRERLNEGVYLSSAWKVAVQEGYGLRTFYLAAFQQQEVCGLLPLVLLTPPWGRRRLVSLPYCDYGGLLGDSEEISGLLLNQALALGGELRAGLEIRCSIANPVLEQESSFSQVTDKCRMVLPLPDSAALLWKGFKSKLRSQVNRARKEGLTNRLGGPELLPEFYQVFTRNMRDLGSPVHSASWLRAVVGSYGQGARIGTVLKDGLPVAAGIMLSHGKTVTVPWASALREFNRHSPNMLLYWTFLEHAADHGFAFFDFGRSTPGEGTYRFKKQWGAEPAPLRWYRLGRNMPRASAAGSGGMLRKAIERVWQRLPLAVANSIGPRMRKHIDR